MRYMLLMYGESLGGPDSEKFRAGVEAVNRFTDECRARGVFRAADPLMPVHAATTVRVRDGETLIIDGPFAETREQLGGYYILDCRDLDEALELAGRCPMAATGSVEVRPIAEVAGSHRVVNALNQAFRE